MLWAAWPVADAALVLPAGTQCRAFSTPQWLRTACKQDPRSRGQTGIDSSGFPRRPGALLSLYLDHDQAVQVGPGPVGVHVADACRRAEHPAAA